MSIDIVKQMSTPNSDIFVLEMDAGTKQLAKGRARTWARIRYPTARPRDITVGSPTDKGTTQSKIVDFIPDSFARNDIQIRVEIKN